MLPNVIVHRSNMSFGVEPHFVTIFELKTLCINAYFVVNLASMPHTDYLSASGMILF